MSARERLTQLIDLASGSSPDVRGALAVELADVLTDWPADYPAHMRASFALLLEKIAPQLDARTRMAVAEKLALDSAVSLSLLNELFFEFKSDKRAGFLRRVVSESVSSEFARPEIDEAALIHSVRAYPPEIFVQTVSRLIGIPLVTAGRAIQDANGEGLALLCRGARLSRLTFSTIAMLTDASLDSGERKLALYETIEEETAAHLVNFWRTLREARRSIPETVVAA